MAAGRLGMDALAHHDVGQGDACGQHSHPYFAMLRLRTVFFNHPKLIGPAVMTDDDSRVPHERAPRIGTGLYGKHVTVSVI